MVLGEGPLGLVTRQGRRALPASLRVHPRFRSREEAERTQLASVRHTRAARDAAAADDALAALKEAATTDANLMEPLIDCARARCTEGEIVGALAAVFGTYRETPAF